MLRLGANHQFGQLFDLSRLGLVGEVVGDLPCP